MYRRLASGLPEDPQYLPDLKSLGFFANKHNQIRRVDDPDKPYSFKVTNSERHNILHAQAFYASVRKEIAARLSQLDVSTLFLPQLKTEKPDGPHICIYATSPKLLLTKKRVIVLVTDEFQDAGLLCSRMIAGDEGLEAGSCISIIKELATRFKHVKPPPSDCGDPTPHANDAPGVVILNPGQLLYSHKLNTAMSSRAWLARPAESAAHPAISVSQSKNYVAGHTTPEEHVASVFRDVVFNTDLIDPQAEVYIIGMQAHGDLVLHYLNDTWTTIPRCVKAIALMQPRHLASSITDRGFADFLARRGRGWSMSPAPRGAVLEVPHSAQGVDGPQVTRDLSAVTQVMYSAGDLPSPESILPTVYKNVLDWFEQVSRDLDNYEKPTIFEQDIWVEKKPNAEIEGDQAFGAEEAAGVAMVEECGSNVVSADSAGTHEPTVKITGAHIPASLAERAGLLSIRDGPGE